MGSRSVRVDNEPRLVQMTVQLEEATARPSRLTWASGRCRHRRERQVDRDLGERAYEADGTDNQENVSYHCTGNQVREHDRGGLAQGR